MITLTRKARANRGERWAARCKAAGVDCERVGDGPAGGWLFRDRAQLAWKAQIYGPEHAGQPYTRGWALLTYWPARGLAVYAGIGSEPCRSLRQALRLARDLRPSGWPGTC